MSEQLTEAEKRQLKALERLDPKTPAGYLPPSTGGARPGPENMDQAPTRHFTMEDVNTEDLTEDERRQLMTLQHLDPRPDGQRHYEDYEVLPGIMNGLVPSAVKGIGNMAQALAPWNWGQTAQTATDIVGGLPLAVGPESWRQNLSPEGQRMLHATQAILQSKADQYGGWDNIKRTAVEDPYAFITDAATLGAPFAGRIAAGLDAAGVPQAGIDAAAIAANPLRLADNPARWAGQGVRAVANQIDPGSEVALRIADGQHVPLRNSLRADSVRVPGSVPNAGAAVVHTNPRPGQAPAPGVTVPAWQAAVKRATEMNSREHAVAEQGRSGARVADINQIGRDHGTTPDQLLRAGGAIDPATASIADLEAARRAANTNNYGPIDPRLVPEDADFLDLMNRAPNNAVMQTAREIAQIEGRPFEAVPGVPATPATTTHSGLFDAHGRPIMTTTPATPGTPAQYRGEDLIRIKKAFDRLATSQELRAKYGIDNDAARALAGARGDYVRWLEHPSRLPEHATAASDNAHWSRLAERRQAAEVFNDVLTGPMEGENQISQRALALMNMMDSPKNVVKGNTANTSKASTFAGRDSWDEILTPGDMEILNRNLEDLNRAKLAEEQAKIGSRRSRDIDSAAPDTRMPAFLNSLITATNAIGGGVRDLVNNRIGQGTANALMAPNTAADMLDAAMVHRAHLDAQSRPFQAVGNAMRAVNHNAPAGYNALNTARQDRERRDRERNNSSR